MKDKETLAHLENLATAHHDETRDMKPLLVVMSGHDNAGDTGFDPQDEKYPGFVLASMRDLLSSSDYREQAEWFAANGFVA